MRKAYSYIRFSSAAQASGNSYHKQRSECIAYCLKHGLTLVDESEYTFFDKGVSAFNGANVDDNSELSRFLNLVKEGDIEPGSTLIIESLDRLSRQHLREALPRFMDILNSGVNIVSLFGERLYTSDYDQLDLFQSIMEMSRSHNESLIKSQRVGAAWRNKQEQARTTGKVLGKTKPAWLDIVDGAYTVNERAAVVEKIFSLTLAGYGKPTVARLLNEEGIPSFKGKSWGASSVQQILSTQTVLGTYQPMSKRQPVGEPILNYYPSVVDAETYAAARQAVQDRFTSRTGRQTQRFHVWQHLAKCALCYGPIHIYTKGSENGSMRCYNAKKGVCKAGSVKLKPSEEVFKEILAKLGNKSLIQASSAKLERDRLTIAGKLAIEEARLKHFAESLENQHNPSQTIINLVYKSEALIDSLRGELAQLTSILASDSILDKDEFFSKLDLTSFDSRSQANRLLKRLKVSALILPSTEFPGDSTTYYVVQDKVIKLIYLCIDDVPVLMKHSQELRERVEQQDKRGQVPVFYWPSEEA